MFKNATTKAEQIALIKSMKLNGDLMKAMAAYHAAVKQNEPIIIKCEALKTNVLYSLELRVSAEWDEPGKPSTPLINEHKFAWLADEADFLNYLNQCTIAFANAGFYPENPDSDACREAEIKIENARNNLMKMFCDLVGWNFRDVLVSDYPQLLALVLDLPKVR